MGTQNRANKKRRWWLIPVIIVLVVGAIGIAATLSDASSRREIAALTIGDVDFSSLQDGTYTGSFVGAEGSLRDVTLEVTILDGMVKDIHVLQGAVDETGTMQEIKNGKSIADLFDDALSSRTLQVDVISGATLTCKTHLKALENALLKAQAEQP